MKINKDVKVIVKAIYDSAQYKNKYELARKGDMAHVANDIHLALHDALSEIGVPKGEPRRAFLLACGCELSH